MARPRKAPACPDEGSDDIARTSRSLPARNQGAGKVLPVAERRERHAPEVQGDKGQHGVRQRLGDLLEWPFGLAFRVDVSLAKPSPSSSSASTGATNCSRWVAAAARAGSSMSHPVKAVPDNVTSSVMIMAAPAGLWPR